MRALTITLAAALPGAALAQDCDAYPHEVRFCPQGTGFSADAPGPVDGIGAYFNGSAGLKIEVADLSVNADTDPARVRPILNGYLAEQKGLEALPLVSETRVEVDGRAAERIAYRNQTREGAGLVADTVVLGEGFAVYVQTFGEGPEFTPSHRALHDAVLAGIDLPEAPL